MDDLPSNYHELEIYVRLGVVLGFLGFNAPLEIWGSEDMQNTLS